jgi:hypothetical protein
VEGDSFLRLTPVSAASVGVFALAGTALGLGLDAGAAALNGKPLGGEPVTDDFGKDLGVTTFGLTEGGVVFRPLVEGPAAVGAVGAVEAEEVEREGIGAPNEAEGDAEREAGGEAGEGAGEEAGEEAGRELAEEAVGKAGAEGVEASAVE